MQRRSAEAFIYGEEGKRARSMRRRLAGVQLKLLIAAIGIADAVHDLTSAGAGISQRVRFRLSARIIAEATSFIDFRRARLSRCSVR